MSYHTTSPNIVIIKTDQQRADTIAAHGNEHMITPNLDRLSNESVNFTNAFCCGATCISSRAAFYSGQYPHNTGCYSFDEWGHNRTWVHEIQEAGYRTAALGKVHHNPHDTMMGFDDRLFVLTFSIEEWVFTDRLGQIAVDDQELGLDAEFAEV